MREVQETSSQPSSLKIHPKVLIYNLVPLPNYISSLFSFTIEYANPTREQWGTSMLAKSAGDCEYEAPV